MRWSEPHQWDTSAGTTEVEESPIEEATVNTEYNWISSFKEENMVESFVNMFVQINLSFHVNMHLNWKWEQFDLQGYQRQQHLCDLKESGNKIYLYKKTVFIW